MHRHKYRDGSYGRGVGHLASASGLSQPSATVQVYKRARSNVTPGEPSRSQYGRATIIHRSDRRTRRGKIFGDDENVAGKLGAFADGFCFCRVNELGGALNELQNTE